MDGKDLVLVLAITVMVSALSGCVQEEKMLQTPTPANTKTPTPTFQNPTPERFIESFITNYNSRNATTIYGMLSERAKAIYSFEDLQEDINAAERLDIKVQEWKAIRKTGEDTVSMTVKMKIILKKESRNVTKNVTLLRENGRWKADSFFLQRLWMYFTPPGQITPIPPSGILNEFIQSYNRRNAEAIYEMMSNRLKANHSLEDVRKEIEFAELKNITILGVDERELIMKDKNLSLLVAELKLAVNGSVSNLTINFSVIYIPYELKKDDWVYARGLKGFIDSWVFDEIRQKIGVRE